MSTRTHFHPARLAALALVLGACQKENPETAPSPAPGESAGPRAAEVRQPPAPSAPSPAPAAEMPLAGQDVKVGTFVETSAYKFRVDGVVRCADPAPTENVPEDRRVRVAAKVAVFSKYDSFFVSAQDVTFEKGGVIINSDRKVKAGAECSPLLEQKRLQHDETATGFVVFQVPDEEFVRDGVVAFRPTRWGGAPRTEIKIGAKDFVTKPSAPK